MSMYVDEAVKTVLGCASTIERQGKSLMIIRDVQANEVGRWMQHVADEMRAACEPEKEGDACQTATPTDQKA